MRQLKAEAPRYAQLLPELPRLVHQRLQERPGREPDPVLLEANVERVRPHCSIADLPGRLGALFACGEPVAIDRDSQLSGRTAENLCFAHVGHGFDDIFDARRDLALLRIVGKTPVAARMLRVGERSGNMGEMMERIAAFYDDELSRFVDVATRLIEPSRWWVSRPRGITAQGWLPSELLGDALA